jgi:uncharacterized protein YndB with AHSA1/START domain
MKWLLIVAVAIVVVVVIVLVIGWALPMKHQASRQATLPAPPDIVWKTITGIDAFPSWRRDVKKIERLPDREGRSVWVEEGSSGRMTLAVERSNPPRLLVLRIADPDLPFGGTWTYDIAAAPGGSRLAITEDGEIYNPFFRFMARFVFGYEGTIKSYLDAIETKLKAES